MNPPVGIAPTRRVIAARRGFARVPELVINLDELNLRELLEAGDERAADIV